MCWTVWPPLPVDKQLRWIEEPSLLPLVSLITLHSSDTSAHYNSPFNALSLYGSYLLLPNNLPSYECLRTSICAHSCLNFVNLLSLFCSTCHVTFLLPTISIVSYCTSMWETFLQTKLLTRDSRRKWRPLHQRTYQGQAGSKLFQGFQMTTHTSREGACTTVSRCGSTIGMLTRTSCTLSLCSRMGRW